jgi:hypothetical protein
VTVNGVPDQDVCWSYIRSVLEEYVSIPDRVAAMLRLSTRSGSAQLFRVGDAMAEDLGIDSEPLREEGYQALASAAQALGPVFDEKGGWADDVNNGLHRQVAEAAFQGMSWNELLAVYDQFHLRDIRPPLQVANPHDIEAMLREHLTVWLSGRVLRLIDQWRKLWRRAAKAS